MPPVSLTPTQQTLLARAIDESSGHIRWFPEGLHGGARQKVLAALAARSLITRDADTWQVTEAGYLALERPLPSFYAQSETESELEPQPELQPESGLQVVFEHEPQAVDAVGVAPVPPPTGSATRCGGHLRAPSRKNWGLPLPLKSPPEVSGSTAASNPDKARKSLKMINKICKKDFAS